MLNDILCGASIVVVAPIVVYYVARLASIAYFKTKREQEKK